MFLKFSCVTLKKLFPPLPCFGEPRPGMTDVQNHVSFASSCGWATMTTQASPNVHAVVCSCNVHSFHVRTAQAMRGVLPRNPHHQFLAASLRVHRIIRLQQRSTPTTPARVPRLNGHAWRQLASVSANLVCSWSAVTQATRLVELSLTSAVHCELQLIQHCPLRLRPGSGTPDSTSTSYHYCQNPIICQ